MPGFLDTILKKQISKFDDYVQPKMSKSQEVAYSTTNKIGDKLIDVIDVVDYIPVVGSGLGVAADIPQAGLKMVLRGTTALGGKIGEKVGSALADDAKKIGQKFKSKKKKKKSSSKKKKMKNPVGTDYARLAKTAKKQAPVKGKTKQKSQGKGKVKANG